jgi:major membrane immunogen (membrane-anchored lipoprotein)
MLKTTTFFTLVVASVVLTACGGSDRPQHGTAQQGDVVMPAPSPSIHFKVNDDKGNTMNLMIECGADTTLKKCAEVNQGIIDKVTQVRADAQKK